MNYKKAGWAYLCTVIYSIAMALLIGFILTDTTGLDYAIATVLDELIIMMPPIAFALLSGNKMSDLFPLKKVKVSTYGYTALYTILLLPLIITINSISMLFVDNAVAGVSDQLLSMPMAVTILLVGVMGPFCEECIFRGFFLQSYKTSGRILFSMILSSVLFGFIHMNFNQASYTIVIGFMLAMLVEATGSLWPAILCHALFNTENVITLYISNMAADSSTEQLAELTDEAYRMYLLQSIASEAIAAIACTYFAIRMIKFIAMKENRSEYFLSIFRRKAKKPDTAVIDTEASAEKPVEKAVKKPNLITIPLVIAMGLILILMITQL